MRCSELSSTKTLAIGRENGYLGNVDIVPSPPVSTKAKPVTYGGNLNELITTELVDKCSTWLAWVALVNIMMVEVSVFLASQLRYCQKTATIHGWVAWFFRWIKPSQESLKNQEQCLELYFRLNANTKTRWWHCCIGCWKRAPSDWAIKFKAVDDFYDIYICVPRWLPISEGVNYRDALVDISYRIILLQPVKQFEPAYLQSTYTQSI